MSVALESSNSPTPFVPLRVVSSGICCSVGNSAASAIAAIRARLNYFRETEFVDDQGSPIHGAMLYGLDEWGGARLWSTYQRVVAECVKQIPREMNSSDVSTLLIVPEEMRFAGLTEAFAQHRIDGLRPAETDVAMRGKAGIGEAMWRATEMFRREHPPSAVVVVGVDSYLNPDSIGHYLQQQRIRCTSNTDGFIPGEAAAAIVLSAHAATGNAPSLWIEGIGRGMEVASPSNDVPLLARGMTQALRAAMVSAKTESCDYSFHASGISGEQWFFKEAALAMDRVLTSKVEEFPHRLLSQSVGEVGAAFGPLALACIGREMMSDEILGARGLLHFANDSGLRTALSVRYG